MYGLIVLVCGLIFGAGLTISKMINPNKIQNFLDFTGHWDPSLAFVMLGAILVTWVGYCFVLKLKAPIFERKFFISTKETIDFKLIFGAAIFGIGWGMAGYCPGPAFTALGLGIMDPVYFILGVGLSLIVYTIANSLHILK